MNNVEVFLDTQKHIENDPVLTQRTQNTITGTQIYDEGFQSKKSPFYGHSNIAFQESLSLAPIRAFANSGKRTAILNFANPVEPGGGVLRGANAQEEYLCRASNLYNCINCSQAKPWYDHHRSILEKNQFRSVFLATDRIIYSKDITIIKQDVGYHPDSVEPFSQEYTDDWLQTDIITCSAPFFSGSEYVLPNGDLEQLFIRRIKNILETAIENNVQLLVLGAFGCGAFHNPPVVVASAFQQALRDNRYFHAFENVIFAVKRTGAFCENIEAFETNFSQFPIDNIFSAERNKKRFFE